MSLCMHRGRLTAWFEIITSCITITLTSLSTRRKLAKNCFKRKQNRRFVSTNELEDCAKNKGDCSFSSMPLHYENPLTRARDLLELLSLTTKYRNFFDLHVSSISLHAWINPFHGWPVINVSSFIFTKYTFYFDNLFVEFFVLTAEIEACNTENKYINTGNVVKQKITLNKIPLIFFKGALVVWW